MGVFVIFVKRYCFFYVHEALRVDNSQHLHTANLHK